MDRELDDLNSFGTKREAVFRQASLFDYKETGIDDGEDEPYQAAELEEEPLDEFSIPDEADQMGVPDAVRYEQGQHSSTVFTDDMDMIETEDAIEKVQPEKNPFSEFDGTENKEQVPAGPMSILWTKKVERLY